MIDFATDMLGDRVEVGDTIVCAFSAGSSATLRVGEVLGFTDKAHSYKTDRVNLITVKWTADSSKYGSVKESNIEAHNGRFLKISK